jgi:hypothetical protein
MDGYMKKRKRKKMIQRWRPIAFLPAGHNCVIDKRMETKPNRTESNQITITKKLIS